MSTIKSESELKQKYESLYKGMVDSKNTKNMMLFGSVMTEMMERAIQRDTSFAQYAIEKLESINWHQYLTYEEANKICESLNQKYEWKFDAWENALKAMELETEQKPYFNKYALWALMNAMHQIHSETLSQKILETTLQEVSDEQMLQIIHALAVDLLSDENGMFNIKEFFYH